MAIWIARNELMELASELSTAAGYGSRFVVYPEGLDNYSASDFETASSIAQAGDTALNIEFARIEELGPFRTQLERSLEREGGEVVVVADYGKMGLDGGDIYSDLERIGMRIPVIEQHLEELGERWGDISLERRIGRFHIGMELYRTEFKGAFRIPEYAILVPKLLGTELIAEHYVAEVIALEEDFKRTIGAELGSGPFVGDGELSVNAMGSRCIDFLLWTHEFPEEGFEQRCKILSGLCQGYPVGKEVEQSMYIVHPELKYQLYHPIQFPYTVKVERAVDMIRDVNDMKLTAREAYENDNLKKAIMEAKNLENLKEEMVRLGFSENLIGQMEAKMAANEPRFILYDELQTDKGRVELALHFNQSRSSEYYYFNKFDVVKEVQPPLAPGEKYFVTSQRQGEDAIVKTFEMPSLAVKEFNARLEASKDIRGAAQIYAGADLGSSKELATMADGKIIDVDKEFYKTLKNPAPGQTIYLEKGNGFTLSQALNLLSGRSVYREDMLNVQKNEYTAWAKLDFDVRDRGGNFHVKTFSEGYGYDLSAVLDRYDLVELKDAKAREVFEAALKNGDMAPATVEVNGKKETILVVAVPEFKQVNMYSLEGKSIKRENVAKEEKIAEVGVGKERTVKKGKEQEEGLSV
ncbi:hypothetical protein WG904_19510 [Pedobacter sp. Du54]|uniref:hypothetical protein n=1 Tax=Pedobacter anseongensis TaxID=3133439 RepID=UPI0030950588